MALHLSRKAQIISQLEKDGKVTQLNDADAERRREAVNNQALKVRRDFQKKERNSWISAARLTLTA
jgi:hypothetical protein